MFGLLAGLTLLSASSSASIPWTLNLYTEEYAPWNYSSEGKVRGINTELLQLVLDDLGYAGHFEVMPWGRAQRFTQVQPNTCFFSAVRTAEREDMYQWVGPLSTEYVQLFSLDPELPKLADFPSARPFRIGGQAEDAYTDYAVNLGLRIERVTEIPVNLSMLQIGRIDLWLAGSIGGPYIAAQNAMQLYPIATSEQAFELWMACHPDTDKTVIQNLNDSLKHLKANGVLEQIVQRYR
ncbi:transporter substrate-binding domain-containing protein [Alkalimonas sp.]|uniref:substrate-binding periplasmic protein n=1 Tax=Alkalimonas sp. TaxID=1872453 RepID=UPI003452D72F